MEASRSGIIIWSCSGSNLTKVPESNRTALEKDLLICWHHFLYAVIPVLLTVFTICGNLFVMAAVVTNERNRRKRTSILICNLALADLLVGAIVMPLAISNILTDFTWLYGRHVCRVWISLDVTCCTASIVTLGLISVDRFIGVTKPLQYARLVTRKRLMLGCFLVWLFSTSTLLTTIRWDWKPELLKQAFYPCHINNEHRHITYAVSLSFCLPLCVILSVYYKIYRVTSRREMSLLKNLHRIYGALPGGRQHAAPCAGHDNKQQNAKVEEEDDDTDIDEDEEDTEEQKGGTHKATDLSHTEPSKEEAHPKLTRVGTARRLLRHSFVLFPLRIHYGGGGNIEKQRKFYNKHKKTAKTLSIIVGAFLVCWLPFFLLYLANHLFKGEEDLVSHVVFEFFTWLGYANSMVNPIIYGLSMKDFKETFHSTYARCFGKLCCCFPCVQRAMFRRSSTRKGGLDKYHEIVPAMIQSYRNAALAATGGMHLINGSSCASAGHQDLAPVARGSLKRQLREHNLGQQIIIENELAVDESVHGVQLVAKTNSYMANMDLYSWLNTAEATEV